MNLILFFSKILIDELINDSGFYRIGYKYMKFLTGIKGLYVEIF
jgi:hypothetical protein